MKAAGSSASRSLSDGPVTVRVPASTSNLGSGFDCVGMAVDLWLTVSARREGTDRRGLPGSREKADHGRQQDRRTGTLEAIDLPPSEDLVRVGFAAACEAAGSEGAAARRAAAELVLDATSDIPIARGLGSSAAAVVAGVILADRMLGLGLDDVNRLEVCARVEGHPDNVAPALSGGAVLALRDSAGRLQVRPLEVHESIALAFAVPDFIVETRAARAALPQTVTHGTAVVAAGRAAALARGLATADRALLEVALDDVLHVPHRRHLVPGFDAVVQAAVRAGAFGATLSGSGPTIVALCPRDSVEIVAAAMVDAWNERGTRADSFVSRAPVPGCRSEGSRSTSQTL